MISKSKIIVVIAAGLLLHLAFATCAAAKVIYTPVNVTVRRNGAIKLNLNQDGITDFVLRSTSELTACGINGGGLIGSTKITPATGDGVVVSHLNFAAVLGSGIPVDRNSTFYNNKAVVTQFRVCQNQSTTVHGYLGLEFLINGQMHYGWAQISIHASFYNFVPTMTTTVIGFAYETIAGKAIETGQTLENLDGLP